VLTLSTCRYLILSNQSVAKAVVRSVFTSWQAEESWGRRTVALAVTYSLKIN